MRLRLSFYWSFVFVNVSLFFPSQSEPTCIEGERAKKLNNRFVQEQNEFRSKHGVPSLELDPKLIKDATDWSYHQAKKGAMEHSKDRKGEGENLAKWFTIKNDSHTPSAQIWYNEIIKYKGGDFSVETGHYTQVAWKNTRKLGCGVCADSEGKNLYITCRYFPSGNSSNQFEENKSLPKLNHTTANQKNTSSKITTKKTPKKYIRSSTSNPRKKPSDIAMKIIQFEITTFILILSSLPIIILGAIFYNYVKKR